jgi:hypothetical protein
MKAPRYFNIKTKYSNSKLYGDISIKRWGWGWLAFSRTKPEHLRDYPVWIAMCLWITVRGLSGKMA